MSRYTGQLTTSQAVLGMGTVVGGCALVVMLCTWLLLPAEQVPPLETLRQGELDLPAEATCEDRMSAVRRRSTPPGLRVDSTSLIECPDTFDGRTVRYRGEAVGVVLRRGDRAWLQLNDDLYALSIGPLPEHRQSLGGNAGMAVNVPVAAADAITAVGDSHHRGDLVTVLGVFRSAAADDGGAPAIMAGNVTSIEPGGEVAAAFSARRMVAAAALLVVTGGVATLRMRERAPWLVTGARRLLRSGGRAS